MVRRQLFISPPDNSMEFVAMFGWNGALVPCRPHLVRWFGRPSFQRPASSIQQHPASASGLGSMQDRGCKWPGSGVESEHPPPELV